MQTVTAENFKSYLNSLGVNPFEIAETASGFLAFFDQKEQISGNVQKRFTSVVLSKKGEALVQVARLGTADFFNRGITSGFFGK